MPASTKRQASGLTAEPPKGSKPSTKRKEPRQPKYQYLNKRQTKTINQTNTGDIGLGDTALKQMPGIEQSYSQPFDYAGGPQAPVTGDYNQWVNNQMGTYANAYDQRMNPNFQQEAEDFEQQMANRGIPVGSELYNQQKQLMKQSQNDARTQAFASGQQNAISGASSLFNVGTQARGNYITEGLQQRNQALSDYSNLMGARSQMPMQNLQYSQQRGMQKQAEDASMAQTQAQIQAQMAMAAMKGGGGGGGSQPVWAQYGFSSPQEYDQYQIQLQQQANPTPKQPNPYASILGQVGGAVLGGWATGGFK
jgi:hypothetical protein